MSSSANVTPSNIVLTPMQVTFNGIDLGATEGGVTVELKTKFADIKADQFGDAPIDSVVSSQEYSVKFMLAETKNKDNWKVAFPFIKEIGSSTKQMYFDMQVGTQLSALAKQLVLHPLQNNPSDKSGDFLFYKAVAKATAQLKYGPDKQVGLEVEMMILPDTTSNPARFLIVGDPTIGVVAATLTQSSFVGTGNGTLASLAAGSAAATETITVTCIHASTSPKIFEVVGSVSGLLGNAREGTAFTSTHLSFTVTAGATAFVLNDVFTLASTSANYA